MLSVSIKKLAALSEMYTLHQIKNQVNEPVLICFKCGRAKTGDYENIPFLYNTGLDNSKK